MRIGAVATAGLTLLTGCSGSSSSGKKSTASPAAATTSSVGGPGGQLQTQYEQVVKNVLPSVVQITTNSGLGSGIVYDTKGDIVTNDHVVAGATKLQVTAATGSKTLTATMVGQFPADDLAVVKVNDTSLKPATFGDSSKLAVGQIVLAMGNPLGLSGSVTDGIVSALGRTVSSQPEGAFPGATTSNAIQTSASINPGNSGGALVTLTDEVVGIPTLAANDPQMGGAAPGIGFATPSNTVKSIADQLISTGKVTNSGRAALGVTVRSVVNEQGTAGGGVGIVSVTPGGAAAQAGIKPGDVITAVNSTPTPDQSALSEVLATMKPGDQAKVTVTRADGSNATLSVTLGQLSGG
jgi:S1-C subfamily serine protease